MNNKNLYLRIKNFIRNQDQLQIKELLYNKDIFTEHWEKILTVMIIENDIPNIKKILAKKPDLNTLNHDSRSPLTIAARKGRIEVLELLLAHGADIHFNNDIAIYEAVHMGQLESVEYLRSKGANYKAKYKSLLHCAERHHNRNGMVDYLVANSPN